MVGFTPIRRGGPQRLATALAFSALLAVAAAGCSSNSDESSTTTTPAATTQATATTHETGTAHATGTAAGAADTDAVTHAFVTFFSGETPGATKITLVQNGDAFADTINAQANSPMATGTTATVSHVDVDAPGHATVTYTVLINGQPVLADQTGEAVQVDGTWKVAESTFCSLLTLEGNPPPVCTATSPMAPPVPTS
ncbi:hypothetical protein [Rhodococcus sp. NPDC003348]